MAAVLVNKQPFQIESIRRVAIILWRCRLQETRLLVVEAGGIGDMVMAEPAVAALKREIPGVRISVLGVPRAIPVLYSCPHVDCVFAMDQRALLGGSFGARLRELARSALVVARLRARRFDAVLNLYQLYSSEGARRMRSLFAMIGARATYGRNTAGRGIFYAESVPDPPDQENVHEVEMNLRVARLLGVRAPLARPRFWVSERDRESAASLAPKLWERGDRPVVAVCPGAEDPYKRWRSERFAGAGVELAGRFGARILLVGGRADVRLLPDMSPLLSAGAESVIGRTSLGQLAALLERCALLIANDSGPAHIAAGVGVPAVVVFGPGRPGRFAPSGDNHVILHRPPACAPCENFGCRDRRCMDAISVEEVVAAASAILRNVKT